MQITKQSLGPTRLKIQIAADADELQSVKRHVLGHYAQSAKVPGFRAGKAPLEAVEKQLNPETLANEFLEHAINGMYKKVLRKEGIRPFGQPKVDIKKFAPFNQLEFEVETQIIGPVKLPNLKQITLAKPSVSVTAGNVNEVIDSLRLRSAERSPVNRPARSGDELVIDFSGFDAKGEPVAGADGRDHPLTLGSSQFIPGFEDELIGAKFGDDKKFSLHFPKDYGVRALRSKKVTFRVKVNKVNELIPPKLSDEFAAKAGPFKSVAELKTDIKRQLKTEREIEADRNYRNQLIRLIADKSRVDIPDSMIDEQVARMEEEEKRNLNFRGTTWQEHLADEGLSEDQHRQRHRPEAAERVKAGLVLNEVAEKEDITVSSEEVDNRLQHLKGQYQDEAMQAELDKPEARQDIAARLLTEKTITKMAEYSKKLAL